MEIAKLPLPGSEAEAHKERNECEPLIPGLPDEISELCLLHLPYPYQALARFVSSTWNRAITEPKFILSRNSLSLTLPYLFVFAFNKSTARIQWQALDLRSGRWFVLPPMPFSNSVCVCPPAFACASLPRQGKLFVMGGMKSDRETPMRTMIMYRTSTNQWSELSSMITPRSFCSAGSINGKIIAVGGSGTSTMESIRAVEIYDPENDTWAGAAKMDMGLTRYDSAVLGKKMYVTEGWTWPFMFSPRGGVYNLEKDTWQEMSKGMREGWSGLSVVLGDRLFVISEYGDCPIKMYVKDDDTWQNVGGDKFPRDRMQRPFAVTGMEGRIFVVSRGLHAAIGKVVIEGVEVKVEWEVVVAPKAFHQLSPCNCELVYA
ncbi:F-box/kelch-repeat protein [Quillaja saponaria]|uniref:F-box/kelch-repeat protein n=1 Tax=Quillaja saponaria TaxID=32244 RepID=A0AAD7PT03_QUISA|nr:F-box/kelch-repeat protein [Quillaja saponaria]